MSDERTGVNAQLQFLHDLIDQRAHIAGDVIAIAPETWAIHGTILVDGGVLLAEFPHVDEATAALQQLGADDLHR